MEESAREQAESLQAEEAAARHTRGGRAADCGDACDGNRNAALLAGKVAAAEETFAQAEANAQELGATVREAQARLVELRRGQQETGQQLERMREGLSAERARRASIEQILSERAYTADAVQKLFNVSGERSADTPGGAFRAVGLLADYAEVQEKYESAIEQFLRDELEYVVVESFDQARAGISLLRDEMGGRATFFVDSLNKLNLAAPEADASLPMPGRRAGASGSLGGIPRAARACGKIFSDEVADGVHGGERGARRADGARKSAQLFSDAGGTCYHGRMVSGGRAGEAGPLALKRELRQHEAEAIRLDATVNEQQAEMTRLEMAIAAVRSRWRPRLRGRWKRKNRLVAATHQRDQARAELRADRAAIRDASARRLRGCMPKRKRRGSVQRMRAREHVRLCNRAKRRKRKTRKFPGGWRRCGRISRRCRSRWWRGAKNWRRCLSGLRARKSCEQHLIAELAAGRRAHGFVAAAARNDGAGKGGAGSSASSCRRRLRNCGRKRCAWKN